MQYAKTDLTGCVDKCDYAIGNIIFKINQKC